MKQDDGNDSWNESWHHWRHALHRAKRATRQNVQLYLVPVLSLTIAFLFLAFACLVVTNLASVADRWRQSGRITVYAQDDASMEQLQRLRSMLQAFPEFRAIRYVSKTDARTQLLAQSQDPEALGMLPLDAFADSLEIEVAAGVSAARLKQIETQLQALPPVQSVETYQGWFSKLDSVLSVGNSLAAALAALVTLCVLAVVSSTIRLAMSSRKQEIEVLKLCGATNRYVRRPFLMEGAIQGFVASSLALIFLGVGFFALQGFAGTMMQMMTGVSLRFLPPLLMFGLLGGGALMGTLASAYSTRGYLLS